MLHSLWFGVWNSDNNKGYSTSSAFCPPVRQASVTALGEDRTTALQQTERI